MLRAHGLQELQREWPRGLPGRAGPRGPGRGGGQSTVLLGAPCPGLLRCLSGPCPFWAGPRGAWPGCACPLQDRPCPPLRLVPSSSLSPGLGGLQTGPQATSTQIFVTHRCLGPPPGSRKPGWPAVWAPPAPRDSGAAPTCPHPAGPTHAHVRPVHSPSPQPPRGGGGSHARGAAEAQTPRSPRWELGWSAPSDSRALALGHWQPPQRAGGPCAPLTAPLSRRAPCCSSTPGGPPSRPCPARPSPAGASGECPAPPGTAPPAGAPRVQQE